MLAREIPIADFIQICLKNLYLKKPAIFTRRFQDFDPIYEIRIGIILTNSEFEEFCNNLKF